MDHQPVYEIAPVLYRAVLDAVAMLEAVGRRREAAHVRAEATRVYSTAWTPDAARRLQGLRDRATRIAEPRGRRRLRRPTLHSLDRRADLGRTTV